MKDRLDIDQVICNFVAKGCAKHWIHPLDQYYAVNRLVNIFQKEHYDTALHPSIPLPSLLQMMDQMVAYAVSQNVIADSQRERDELEAEIMDVITPAPSVVNRDFWDCYKEAPLRATNEFYELCRANDYIKTRQIEKNEQFMVDSDYGKMAITINLSKPEKSKKDIEEAQMATGDYPLCQLCAENEGYKGRIGIAGRTNHRVIRIPLGGENWGFQYSPYAYYNEHCIVFSKKHEPMNVTKTTIQNLLEIISILPHYFMGSNAGLPIVGGSLLGHEHYQGGRHHFPMEKAQVLESWTWKGLPEVKAERLHWPLSVIRLRSLSPEDLVTVGTEIMTAWKSYSNEQLGILAQTGTDEHNAVTLISRRNGENYELDVVLRNNRTSEEFPDGIFHPHQDVQHIKKENIGLIEVLGMAILPPRLKTELQEVEGYLLGLDVTVASYHKDWADELKRRTHPTEETVTDIMQKAIGVKFQRVLEDAGVFKQNEEGQATFQDFIKGFQ